MIKFGTIGTGWIAKDFIKAMSMQEQGIVSACYSRDLNKANDFIKELNINAAAFDSIEEMAKNIDAVYIASPNGLHFEQARFFLENKVHVFVEKPITMKLKHLEELQKIANDNNLILMEAYKTIHLPQFIKLKELVNKGKPQVASFMMNQFSSRMYDVQKGIYNSVFDAKLGRGSTYDMLVYPVELAVALFGEIKDFNHFTSRLENGVAIVNIVSIQHTNGMLTNITCSKNTHGATASEINFDDMTITINKLTLLENITVINYVRRMGPFRLDLPESSDAFYYETKTFIEMISNKNFEQMNKLLKINLETIKVLETID